MTKKVVAYYDNIFLVATQEERTSSHRITARDSQKRPGTIRFSGNFPMPDSDNTYGTLVLNEDKWKEWFSRRKCLPGRETAEITAVSLVTQFANIYFGCPLCTFKGKDLDEARAHIHAHINKFVQQFRIEIVEEDSDGNNI